MSMLTPETKLTGFWYEMIRLSDSQEKQIALAEKIARLFSLVDADADESVATE